MSEGKRTQAFIKEARKQSLRQEAPLQTRPSHYPTNVTFYFSKHILSILDHVLERPQHRDEKHIVSIAWIVVH